MKYIRLGIKGVNEGVHEGGRIRISSMSVCDVRAVLTDGYSGCEGW